MNDNIAETFFLTEQIVKELDKIITENRETHIAVSKYQLVYKSQGYVKQACDDNVLSIIGHLEIKLPESNLKLEYNILVEYFKQYGSLIYRYCSYSHNTITLKQEGKEDITFANTMLNKMSNQAKANMLYPVLKYKDTREAVGGSYETRN